MTVMRARRLRRRVAIIPSAVQRLEPCSTGSTLCGALTATATAAVLADILSQLAMSDPLVVRSGIERPNLFVEVLRTAPEFEKRQRVLSLLRDRKPPGLIYCATIRLAEEVHGWLEQHEFVVELYHGKLSVAARKEAQRGFIEMHLSQSAPPRAQPISRSPRRTRSTSTYMCRSDYKSRMLAEVALLRVAATLAGA
jgi:hypothetical protein